MRASIDLNSVDFSRRQMRRATVFTERTLPIVAQMLRKQFATPCPARSYCRGTGRTLCKTR
jgi:hypothetical protein